MYLVRSADWSRLVRRSSKSESGRLNPPPPQPARRMGYSVPCADHRRGLIRRGCFFFTVDLPERRITPEPALGPRVSLTDPVGSNPRYVFVNATASAPRFPFARRPWLPSSVVSRSFALLRGFAQDAVSSCAAICVTDIRSHCRPSFLA